MLGFVGISEYTSLKLVNFSQYTHLQNEYTHQQGHITQPKALNTSMTPVIGTYIPTLIIDILIKVMDTYTLVIRTLTMVIDVKTLTMRIMTMQVYILNLLMHILTLVIYVYILMMDILGITDPSDTYLTQMIGIRSLM